MSMQTTRTEITNAVGTVEGLFADERQPDTPVEGSAWVVWADSTPLTQGAFDTRWYVFVRLPDNSDAAVDAIHGLIDEVATAIQTKVYGAAVTNVRPGKLDASENSPKVLRFDVRTPTTYGA